MPSEPVAIRPGLNLTDLENLLGQREQLLGALLSIGHDETDSLFTFDEEHDPEDDQLVTLRMAGNAPITTPPGFDLVCEGDTFVGDSLVHIAAFRALAAGTAPMPVPAAPGEDLLLKALRIAVRINEIGNASPYQLSFAKRGQSGGSFGFTQGDLAGKQQIVQETFLQVLATAHIADNNVTARLSQHLAQNPLTDLETAQVNAALSSPAGQQLVDAMDEVIFSELRKDLDRCIIAGGGRTIDPVAQIYMLLWINMTGKPTKLLDWLGGQAVTLAKPVPAPVAAVGAAEIETYLLASDFFTKNPRNFPHLRQSVAAGVAVLQAGDPVMPPPAPPHEAPGPLPPPAAPVRLTAAPNIDLKATFAIRQLVEIVGEASRTLSDGFRVVVTSTLRPGSRVAGTGGISRHATGEAIDVQIINPQGQAIPNKGNDTTGRYKQLAVGAFHANERLFPARHGQLAWGGEFTTGPADGPRDLMHFDYGGDRGHFGRLANEAATA